MHVCRTGCRGQDCSVLCYVFSQRSVSDNGDTMTVPDTPDIDVVDASVETPNSASQLLAQGAGRAYSCLCTGEMSVILETLKMHCL